MQYLLKHPRQALFSAFETPKADSFAAASSKI
jgi:hypothetical protein